MINNLDSKLAAVNKPGNREYLLDALKYLSDSDCDFNGENEEDYSWETTRETGFESNQDYVIDFVKDIDDDETCANTFFEMWLMSDSYYHDYQTNYLKDDNGNITAISLAVLSGS